MTASFDSAAPSSSSSSSLSSSSFANSFSSLPEQISSLSADSLTFLRGKALVFYRGGEEQQPMRGWSSEISSGCCEVEAPEEISLGNGEERDIVGIDSSVIVLGEAEDGFILSGKAAVAARSKGKNQAYLIGPLVFYIGERNIDSLNFFEKVPRNLILHDSSIAARALRVLLERILAYQLACNMSDGILLVDGSLKESNFEVKDASLKQIIAESSQRGNYVAAITKNTKIKQLQRIESLLYSLQKPAYLDVTEVVRLFISGLAANSYLAKLSGDGIPLRMDIPVTQAPDKLIPSIMLSDLITNGYPETLRSAHLLSIFTASEEASVKSRLARNEGTTVLPSFSIRRAILGRLEGYKR
ncbi:MAG: DNA double-strand break repair nuclease NurA [Conexivisphaerales archaeon]